MKVIGRVAGAQFAQKYAAIGTCCAFCRDPRIPMILFFGVSGSWTFSDAKLFDLFS